MKLVSAESSEKKRKGTIYTLYCKLLAYKSTELEKTIVQWRPDKEVPLCQWCSKSFNVRRRRHHCRLCGSIMCKKCSIFLLFSEARKCHNHRLQKFFHPTHTHVYAVLLFTILVAGTPCLLHHPKRKENSRRTLIRRR